MIVQKPVARVAAVHQLEHAVAAALHGDVRALDQLGQTPVSCHQIIAIALRMRRREADALEAFDVMHGFEQLDERGDLPSSRRDVALAVAGDDLAEQSDFLHAARRQLATLGDDVGNASGCALRRACTARCRTCSTGCSLA